MNKDPKQMNNLLGDVEYGQGYGTFIKHAKKQLPKLKKTITQLDNRLTTLLKETNGRRSPKWSD